MLYKYTRNVYYRLEQVAAVPNDNAKETCPPCGPVCCPEPCADEDEKKAEDEKDSNKKDSDKKAADKAPGTTKNNSCNATDASRFRSASFLSDEEDPTLPRCSSPCPPYSLPSSEYPGGCLPALPTSCYLLQRRSKLFPPAGFPFKPCCPTPDDQPCRPRSPAAPRSGLRDPCRRRCPDHLPQRSLLSEPLTPFAHRRPTPTSSST